MASSRHSSSVDWALTHLVLCLVLALGHCLTKLGGAKILTNEMTVPVVCFGNGVVFNTTAFCILLLLSLT